MFAIAFDLVVKDTAEYHPKGIPAAYAESALQAGFGFRPLCAIFELSVLNNGLILLKE